MSNKSGCPEPHLDVEIIEWELPEGIRKHLEDLDKIYKSIFFEHSFVTTPADSGVGLHALMERDDYNLKSRLRLT